MYNTVCFLNLGVPEIIFILLVFSFWTMIITGIVFLIRYLIKSITQKEIIVTHISKTNTNNHLRPQPAEHEKEKELHSETSANNKIALPQQSQIRYVNIEEIIRCEADDNYTMFILTSEKVLISKSLKEYADLLKPKGFLRTHQSHLINPQFVNSWLKQDGGTLLLQNGDKIPVSKPHREFVKQALSN